MCVDDGIGDSHGLVLYVFVADFIPSPSLILDETGDSNEIIFYLIGNILAASNRSSFHPAAVHSAPL